MRNLITLKDLLIEQLRELYNAEKQEYNALLTLKEKASTRELRLVIQNQVAETKEQINRLEEIFKDLEITCLGEQSSVMSELIKEGYNLAARGSDPEILDAGLIAAIQYMKHFEIASYGTVHAFAKKLGMPAVAKRLFESLMEERRTDQRLTEIANDKINERALAPLIH